MKIYVACPHAYVTGGIELLHQLVHELNKHSFVEAKIWYLGENLDNPQPKEYDIYGNSYEVTTEPPSDCTLIFPEIWADCARYKQYQKHRRVIYWESVDNYVSRYPNYREQKFPEDILHLVQSHYAYVFLTSQMGIPDSQILYVTDYINEEFLAEYGDVKRSRIVLYNPNKGLEFTKKIIDLLPDTVFIPLKGMSRKDMIHTMHSSMLYIDFGNHPGKDRMPREAAICGCCVITSQKGSAAFPQDVPIADEYKFDIDDESNIGLIVDKITTILNDYEKTTYDFDEYREIIRKEHALFSNQVSLLAERLWIPRFSIIIPAYNAENHIRKALDSVKSQVFTDYELIVVCDSCVDNTAAVAREYGADVYEAQYGNDGLSRNRGIDEARGEFLLFMDDDDWWMHEYVLTEIDAKLKECPDVDILCFSFIFKGWKYADPQGCNGGRWVAVWSKCWRRAFVGDTRFPKIDMCSDRYFSNEVFAKKPKVVDWDRLMYYYNFMRKGSQTELDRRSE